MTPMARLRPIPDRPLLDRPPNYDHDFDGRPPVEFGGCDLLLELLIKHHPEVAMRLRLKSKLGPGPRTILATASD